MPGARLDALAAAFVTTLARLQRARGGLLGEALFAEEALGRSGAPEIRATNVSHGGQFHQLLDTSKNFAGLRMRAWRVPQRAVRMLAGACFALFSSLAYVQYDVSCSGTYEIDFFDPDCFLSGADLSCTRGDPSAVEFPACVNATVAPGESVAIGNTVLIYQSVGAGTYLLTTEDGGAVPTWSQALFPLTLPTTSFSNVRPGSNVLFQVLGYGNRTDGRAPIRRSI